MLEKNFSKRRMICAVAVLGGISVLIIILESRALSAASVEGTASSVDIHESHPILKQNLTSGDKCWKNEDFAVVEPCDFCTESEIKNRDPIVCVAKGKKEKVECIKSQRRTFKSCDVVQWAEDKKFWLFEAAALFVGVLAMASISYRQNQLNQYAYSKLKKTAGTN